MYPVPTECPVCHDDLHVSQLVCRTCGAEILTAAIGEYGLDECQDCRKAREERQTVELAEGIARSRESVARHVAFDEYSEPY